MWSEFFLVARAVVIPYVVMKAVASAMAGISQLVRDSVETLSHISVVQEALETEVGLEYLVHSDALWEKRLSCSFGFEILCRDSKGQELLAQLLNRLTQISPVAKQIKLMKNWVSKMQEHHVFFAAKADSEPLFAVLCRTELGCHLLTLMLSNQHLKAIAFQIDPEDLSVIFSGDQSILKDLPESGMNMLKLLFEINPRLIESMDIPSIARSIFFWGSKKSGAAVLHQLFVKRNSRWFADLIAEIPVMSKEIGLRNSKQTEASCWDFIISFLAKTDEGVQILSMLIKYLTSEQISGCNLSVISVLKGGHEADALPTCLNLVQTQAGQIILKRLLQEPRVIASVPKDFLFILYPDQHNPRLLIRALSSLSRTQEGCEVLNLLLDTRPDLLTHDACVATAVLFSWKDNTQESEGVVSDFYHLYKTHYGRDFLEKILKRDLQYLISAPIGALCRSTQGRPAMAVLPVILCLRATYHDVYIQLMLERLTETVPDIASVLQCFLESLMQNDLAEALIIDIPLFNRILCDQLSRSGHSDLLNVKLNEKAEIVIQCPEQSLLMLERLLGIVHTSFQHALEIVRVRIDEEILKAQETKRKHQEQERAEQEERAKLQALSWECNDLLNRLELACFEKEARMQERFKKWEEYGVAVTKALSKVVIDMDQLLAKKPAEKGAPEYDFEREALQKIRTVRDYCHAQDELIYAGLMGKESIIKKLYQFSADIQSYKRDFLTKIGREMEPFLFKLQQMNQDFLNFQSERLLGAKPDFERLEELVTGVRRAKVKVEAHAAKKEQNIAVDIPLCIVVKGGRDPEPSPPSAAHESRVARVEVKEEEPVLEARAPVAVKTYAEYQIQNGELQMRLQNIMVLCSMFGSEPWGAVKSIYRYSILGALTDLVGFVLENHLLQGEHENHFKRLDVMLVHRIFIGFADPRSQADCYELFDQLVIEKLPSIRNSIERFELREFVDACSMERGPFHVIVNRDFFRQFMVKKLSELAVLNHEMQRATTHLSGADHCHWYYEAFYAHIREIREVHVLAIHQIGEIEEGLTGLELSQAMLAAQPRVNSELGLRRAQVDLLNILRIKRNDQRHQRLEEFTLDALVIEIVQLNSVFSHFSPPVTPATARKKLSADAPDFVPGQALMSSSSQVATVFSELALRDRIGGETAAVLDTP